MNPSRKEQSASTLSVLHEAVVPIEMMLATVAKTLCSAVFVSGRAPEEAAQHSCWWSLKAQLLPEALRRHAHWRLDRAQRRVDISIDIGRAVADDLIAEHRAIHPGFEADWAGEHARLVGLRHVTRSAQFLGSQGSIIVPRDGKLDLHFEPRTIMRGPASSAGWPGGDAASDPQAVATRAAPSRRCWTPASPIPTPTTPRRWSCTAAASSASATGTASAPTRRWKAGRWARAPWAR